MSELLVPMNLEALVVGQSDAGAQWVNLKPDFRGVYRRDQVLGQQLGTPLEFSPSMLGLKPGVHLHWALPDGLTHGVAPENGGSPEFPAIPNRWLVVRFWDQNGANQSLALKAKAWIVESDSVTSDSSAAVWPTFGGENLKKSDDYSVFVGKQSELSQWPGETAGARVTITAVGYGDAAFAAYYPACKGIIGFHDQDLSDVMAGANLDYMVVGWYADLAVDPLQRALAMQKPEQLFDALDEFLGAKKWTYPGFAAAHDKATRMKASADELKEAGEMMARLQAAGSKIEVPPRSPNCSARSAISKRKPRNSPARSRRFRAKSRAELSATGSLPAFKPRPISTMVFRAASPFAFRSVTPRWRLWRRCLKPNAATIWENCWRFFSTIS
jgi:hypothetical protein